MLGGGGFGLQAGSAAEPGVCVDEAGSRNNRDRSVIASMADQRAIKSTRESRGTVTTHLAG